MIVARLRFLLFLVPCCFCLAPRAQNTPVDGRRENIQPAISEIQLQDMGAESVAATAFLSHSLVSVRLSNRFFIKELMEEQVDGVLRVEENAVIFRASHLGWAHYGEVAVAAGYARSFGRHVAVGVRFHYLMEHAQEYRSTHSFTFDVSLYAKIARNLGLGFSVYNPARLKYGVVGRTPLPTRFRLDIAYRIGKHALLFGRVKKELKTPFEIDIGAAYQVKCLFLEAGFTFPRPEFGLRVGVTYRGFFFHLEEKYLLYAGFWQSIGIRYLFK